MKITILAAVLLIAACSSTGVVPTGADTYMIAKTSPACGFRSASGTKAKIYKEAAEFCQDLGKAVQTIRTREVDGVVGRNCASAEIEFTCLERPRTKKRMADNEIRL